MSHISGTSALWLEQLSVSPCLYHLGPYHPKSVEAVMSLLVGLGTHFQGILLVKKHHKPELEDVGNCSNLLIGVVA